MRLRQGVQAEILISLALVMAAGTALLAAVLLEINDARIESLHGLLGRGFVDSTRNGILELEAAGNGQWWKIDGRESVRGLNASARDLDPGTRALARESRATGRPLVESGAPWQPIRFAAPGREGSETIAGRMDPPLPAALLALVIFVDVVIFVLFGWTLLRRRVVGPLRRLVAAVRGIGDADAGVEIAVEGVDEIASLARTFNEMQVALAARTGALEKAVQDLRTANANLLQAREGLDRAERLALVGSLAAGVAHEVGNPMGALLAFLDIAGRDPGLGEQGRRSIVRAAEQGERVRVILRQLLDFSRPPRIERGPLDLADVVRRVVELVSTQHAADGIEFEIEIDGETPPARGDLGIALQVLLNLALNAVAAVRGREVRRIRFEVAAGLRRRRAGEASSRVVIARTDSVICRVIDSGPGVAADHAERIFDPFFTTKPPGEGTGLGLANARRLAEEMEGAVELERGPNPLGGACFRFVVPLHSETSPGDGVREAVPAQSRMS
ncbi:MAG: ATP-binding protein [Myxococcota bacterium]